MLISCYPVGAAVCRHFKFIDILDTFALCGFPFAFSVVYAWSSMYLLWSRLASTALTLTHPIPHISSHPTRPITSYAALLLVKGSLDLPPDHPCSPFAPRPSPSMTSLDLPPVPFRSSPLSCGQGQPRPLSVPPFALAPPWRSHMLASIVYAMQLA